MPQHVIPPQPQVLYIVTPAPVVIPRPLPVTTCLQRTRIVYWGNWYLRTLTLVSVALLICGVTLFALDVSKPVNHCNSGCVESPCTASNRVTYPCDCGLTCESTIVVQLRLENRVGRALALIGGIALILQSFVACGGCGDCWTPTLTTPT